MARKGRGRKRAKPRPVLKEDSEFLKRVTATSNSGGIVTENNGSSDFIPSEMQTSNQLLISTYVPKSSTVQKVAQKQDSDDTHIDKVVRRVYAQKHKLAQDPPITEAEIESMHDCEVDGKWVLVRIGESFKITYTSKWPALSKFRHQAPLNHQGVRFSRDGPNGGVIATTAELFYHNITTSMAHCLRCAKPIKTFLRSCPQDKKWEPCCCDYGTDLLEPVYNINGTRKLAEYVSISSCSERNIPSRKGQKRQKSLKPSFDLHMRIPRERRTKLDNSWLKNLSDVKVSRIPKPMLIRVSEKLLSADGEQIDSSVNIGCVRLGAKNGCVKIKASQTQQIISGKKPKKPTQIKFSKKKIQRLVEGLPWTKPPSPEPLHRELECPRCSRIFKYAKSLQNHLLKCSNEQVKRKMDPTVIADELESDFSNDEGIYTGNNEPVGTADNQKSNSHLNSDGDSVSDSDQISSSKKSSHNGNMIQEKSKSGRKKRKVQKDISRDLSANGDEDDDLEPEWLPTLNCSICNAGFTQRSLGFTDSQWDKVSSEQSRKNWQCLDCKSCYVCTKLGMRDIKKSTEPHLIVCTQCDEAFHVECIGVDSTFDIDNFVCEPCATTKHAELLLSITKQGRDKKDYNPAIHGPEWTDDVESALEAVLKKYPKEKRWIRRAGSFFSRDKLAVNYLQKRTRKTWPRRLILRKILRIKYEKQDAIAASRARNTKVSTFWQPSYGIAELQSGVAVQLNPKQAAAWFGPMPKTKEVTADISTTTLQPKQAAAWFTPLIVNSYSRNSIANSMAFSASDSKTAEPLLSSNNISPGKALSAIKQSKQAAVWHGPGVSSESNTKIQAPAAVSYISQISDVKESVPIEASGPAVNISTSQAMVESIKATIASQI